MSDELALTNVSDTQAREVGLPTRDALNYMMSVANMLLTSNLLGPDLEPSKDTLGSLKAAGWDQAAIDEYRDKVIRSNALAKMLVGREMGMQSMEALQSIDIVKGKLFVRYPAHIKQMEMKGYRCTWVERSNDRAALEVEKNGEKTLFEFTIEDAKRAGLLDAPPGKEQYNQYRLRPRVMLTARVASEANRTTGGSSNMYTPEEKDEVLGRDSTMGEPTEADQKHLEQLQNKYHVGVRPEAQAAAAAAGAGTSPAATANVAPEPAKPTETPKPPDKVVEMPKQETAPTKPAKTTRAEAKPEPEVKYYICTLVNGQPVAVPGEAPDPNLDTAKMLAQAMANKTGVQHFVYPAASGKMTDKSSFDAVPPQKPAAKAPAPAPSAPAAPVTQNGTSFKDRLIAATKTVAAIINKDVAADKATPEKTVSARVATFFLGYFDVSKLGDLKEVYENPDNAEQFANAFADLESSVTQDPIAWLSDPADNAKRLAVRTSRTLGLLRGELKWTPVCVDLGMKLMRLRGFDHADMNMFLINGGLIKQVNGGPYQSADPADIQAGLQLCVRTRNGGKLLRECANHNLSIARTVAQMEQRRFKNWKILDVTQAEVDSGIEWALNDIRETLTAKPTAPAAAAPAPAPPPPPAEPEGEDDNLFRDLP